MKRCSIEPYSGPDNYIYIIYSQEDKGRVFPIIERMVKDGYRVWFNDVESSVLEHSEILECYLNNCSACIIFLSEKALRSHAFRMEFNSVILKKKLFTAINLEPVVVSLVMQMQFSTGEIISKYGLQKDETFFKTLYNFDFLNSSKGKPNPNILISSPTDYQNPLEDLFSDFGLGSQTFKKDKPYYGSQQNHEEPQVHDELYHFIVRTKTNEKIPITLDGVKIGRSDACCDYIIENNSAIGRFHAFIVLENDGVTIVDNNSENGTFINNEAITPNEKYFLHDRDVVRLANEKFVFYQK